ncbi:MAG: CNNM domain-containing protein [Planctomycetes bacterium]|nr:CNNM domain-containing protein [Planctomycetota bacterium]
MNTPLIDLGAAAALIGLNGFFVLAEFALIKVRATRLRELSEGGSVNARHALAILARIDAHLSTCQLGITIASLALGWVGEPALARLLAPALHAVGIGSDTVVHTVSFAVSFLLLTGTHIIIGEQAPKLFAIRRAEIAALAIARPLRVFHAISYPAMWVLSAATNLVLRLLRIPPGSEHELAHSETELKMLLGASHEQGMFTLSRLLMMENVLDFGTLRVQDVMLPAAKVATLDASKPWKDNLEVIEHTLHSRYPLVAPRIEKEVHVKDMALAMARGLAVDLNAIARPVLRVSPEMPVEELLKKFLSGGPHLATVEKDGKLAGIVTMEDVLEELVGTIRDEFEQVKDYRLSEIVSTEAVCLDLVPGSKEQIIRRLALGIAKSRKDVDPGKALPAVLKREALASTGLGMGVAIPHGRVEGLERPAAALGRSSQGLDFKSLDGKPVHLVFLILSPPHDEGAHLHILEKISSLLLSDYLRDRLEKAQTAEEVMEVFRLSDKSIPA